VYPEIFIGGGQLGWGLDRGSPPQWGWVWEGLCQKKNSDGNGAFW